MNIKYTDMYSKCSTDRFRYIENALEGCIVNISKRYQVPIFDIMVHLRLLLPITLCIPYCDYSLQQLTLLFEKKLNETIQRYRTNLYSYKKDCGIEELSNYQQIRCDSLGNLFCVSNLDDKTIRLFVDNVELEDSVFIENSLHYIHQHRSDSLLRLGLYVYGYSKPVAFVCASKADREDKICALKRATGYNDEHDVYEIGRVYGCDYLPRNCISYLISACNRALYSLYGAKYVLTAVNPYFGFSGASILASNFTPFALRPVHYYYSSNLDYTATRGRVKGEFYYSATGMPPNILFVRKLFGRPFKKIDR